MRHTRFALLTACLALCAGAFAGLGPMQIKEHAAEVSSLTLSGSPSQLLYLRECDECESLTVSLDAKTQYFDHRTAVSAAQAARLAGRDATVFFDPETRVVTRIVFWKKVTS